MGSSAISDFSFLKMEWLCCRHVDNVVVTKYTTEFKSSRQSQINIFCKIKFVLEFYLIPTTWSPNNFEKVYKIKPYSSVRKSTIIKW